MMRRSSRICIGVIFAWSKQTLRYQLFIPLSIPHNVIRRVSAVITHAVRALLCVCACTCAVIIPGATIDANRPLRGVSCCSLSREYPSITDTRVAVWESTYRFYAEHAYGVLALNTCNYIAKRHGTKRGFWRRIRFLERLASFAVRRMQSSCQCDKRRREHDAFIIVSYIVISVVLHFYRIAYCIICCPQLEKYTRSFRNFVA